MAGDGNVIGSTKAALGQRPGESIMYSYVGGAQDGDIILTYMDTLTQYQVTALTHPESATEAAYSVGVYQVSQPYGRVYLSVYSQLDGIVTAGTVPVSVLLFGNR